MKIRVEGKAHLQGTSRKTGKPYDFIAIHYLGMDRQVIGKAAMTLALEPQNYDFDAIVVGSDVNVEFDNRGNVVTFSPVTAK